MKLLKIAALVAAMGAVSAQAATVGYISVTGSAGVTNAELAGNGVFSPDGIYWQTGTAWWEGPWESPTDYVQFEFDKPYQITGIKLSVDNNDFYRVELSKNGSDWVDYHTVLAFEGAVNGGMDTFTPSKPSTSEAFSFARVTALYGDRFYSVGEVQFNGVAAVPEPETLALMLGGIAALGLKLRRRAR